MGGAGGNVTLGEGLGLGAGVVGTGLGDVEGTGDAEVLGVGELVGFVVEDVVGFGVGTTGVGETFGAVGKSGRWNPVA